MLEEARYIVSTHTKGDRVVTTPKGKKFVFKRDIGVCKGIPYIDFCKHKGGISMIETIHKKLAGATRRNIDNAFQSCTVQRSIG